MNPQPSDGLLIIDYLPNASNFLKKLENKEKINLMVYDLQKNYKFNELPLNIIYEQCQILSLKLKGFSTNETDFEEFCCQLPRFQQLQNFKLRFYNKWIQNLDTLFLNTKEIDQVELNLKNFKKIILTQDVSDQLQIKKLSLNLKNVTLNNNESYKILQRYIGSKSLNQVQISLNKINLICLTIEQKTASILLDIYDEKVDIKFCKDLAAFINNNNFKNMSINKCHFTDSIYLNACGIKLNDNQSERKIISFNTSGLTNNDFELIKEVPQLLNRISKVLSFSGQTKQFEKIYQYFVMPFNKYNQNYTFYFDFYINYLAKRNLMMLFIDSNQLKLLKHLQFLVNFKIKKRQQYNVQQVVSLMKWISKFKFIVYFKISFPQNLINTKPNEFTQKILKKYEKVIREKSIHKLRYFVFLKQIYQLLPLPQQIFYDLIDI